MFPLTHLFEKRLWLIVFVLLSKPHTVLRRYSCWCPLSFLEIFRQVRRSEPAA